MSAKVSFDSFIEDLRAPTGAPGGGAAAAVSASMGCALYQMVAGVTLTLPRFTQGRERLEEIRVTASSLCDQFGELARKDEEAYKAVERAMKMPRATPEEKALRRDAMQDAFKVATLVPLETVETCVSCLGLLQDLLEYGNPNAITDVAVGTLLVDAALRGAAMNAEINLSSIKDPEFLESARRRLTDYRQSAASVWPSLETAAKASGITL